MPSEDPLLNGDFGEQYTRGIQTGEDARFIKTVVTLKHWDAYSLENSDGFNRHNFDAVVSPYVFDTEPTPRTKTPHPIQSSSYAATASHLHIFPPSARAW